MFAAPYGRCRLYNLMNKLECLFSYEIIFCFVYFKLDYLIS